MARVEIDRDGLTALGDHVNHKFGDVALDMGVDAERYAPVRTGALKISVHVVEDSAGHWRIVAGTGLPDGRAVYQEEGTSKMRAQPYIRPAVYKKRAV